MTYRMLLAGLLLISTQTVVATEPEAPASPQPTAESADTATQQVNGDKPKEAQPTDTEKSADKPDAGAAEPDCD